MIYEPKQWKHGDTITAEDLNHIEEGIAECDSDVGYSYTETYEELFEETVTTELHAPSTPSAGLIQYSALLDADVLKVTFDETEYICEKYVFYADDNYNAYGAFFNPLDMSYDWSEYPFLIASNKSQFDVQNLLITETAGTYSIKVEAIEVSIEDISERFKKAVQSINVGFECTEEVSPIYEGTIITTLDGDVNVGTIPNVSLPEGQTIRVTYDNSEYICRYNTYGGAWGETYCEVAPSSWRWDGYPFSIQNESLANQLYIITETAGEHSITIESYNASIDTSDCFKKSARDAVMFKLEIGVTLYQEAVDAFNEDKILYFKDYDDIVHFVNRINGYSVDTTSNTNAAYFETGSKIFRCDRGR